MEKKSKTTSKTNNSSAKTIKKPCLCSSPKGLSSASKSSSASPKSNSITSKSSAASPKSNSAASKSLNTTSKSRDTSSSSSNDSKNKKINFCYFAPEAHQVSLVGDFNNWAYDACPLTRKDSGEWMTSLSLKPGTYDYRFIVDGEWRDDPKNVEKVANPFGTLNDRIEIK